MSDLINPGYYDDSAIHAYADNTIVIYLCDPDKFTTCPKTLCQRKCFCTSKEQYAYEEKFR